MSSPLADPRTAPLVSTVLSGRPHSPLLRWFADGLTATLHQNGHTLVEAGETAPRLAVHFVDADRPRPFRRKAQGTFVVSVTEVAERPDDLLKAAYPLLVRSLSNLLIYLVNEPAGPRTYFVTLEQGYYQVERDSSDDEGYFEAVYRRMRPLATSQLVINNRYLKNLPEPHWSGNPRTEALAAAGRRLGAMNLLPTPFPIQEWLPAREMAHVRRLFGIGGLSYGNLSIREDASSFWMSASGVDKAQMRVVGRDMLLITDYLPAERAMVVSVPPHVEPRRASVDAVEHWMLYTEHPSIGAIIHVHAWMEGVPSTTVNYPCGTAELAREVAELVRREPDPSRAVIGLKNHGLTITGRSLEEILGRIEGRLLPQVPMQ
ncbi:MAG: class II aldolase/adducin family protein [Bacillota bacterium]